MPNLGSLFYTMGIRDMTDADLKRINAKLKNVGSEILLTPKILKDLTQSAVPKGIKIELDPTIKSEAIAKAIEGKTMRVAVTPLLTGFREAIAKATRDNPPQAEIGVSEARLRTLVQNVLNRQGFILNVSTVNDNYSKAIQQKLNGTRYTVKIHADANEITRSVQASLMQVQSRYFGLKVSRDVLYRSIDEALGQKRFNISIAVQQDQARKAVQDALLRAQLIGKDQALAYQRLQTGEIRAAQAELAKLKAAHLGAADAAKAHATASVSLGGAMGRNITIAGEFGSAMASLYSVHAAKEFLSQVIDIGGELEHQKIAMNTIFGDAGKTNELFGQIKGLARTSPFGVMELSKSVKALSAYGVQYNEIYDTAKRLADISAATSVDINRLILAFGKTRSRGFLDGLEAKQFAYANIPIYEMVRKKLEELEGQAVTTAEVMERMRKREIGFDIVKDVLWDITDPGGKFYNMQEALAGSVKTSWKLVRDNIELMFGEIAESSIGGGLKGVAEMLQVLTRNWETMGAVIGTAALSFGVYKVAILAANAATGKNIALSLSSVASKKALNEANMRAAISYRSLTDAEADNLVASRAAHKLTGLRALSRKQLTFREVEALYATKALTQEQVLQLVALKRVTASDAQRLLITRTMTATQKAAIQAEIARAAAVKRSAVIWGQLRGQLIKVLATLKSFMLATIPLAAISALATIWQKNNEQMEKAKEIGDNIFTKATEGANNLSQTIKGIKPPAGMSDHELTQGIEQMEQAIKDYSPRPIEDINNALVAQDGHVMTLTERYDALRKRVEEVSAAYSTMGNSRNGDFGTMVANSINVTGGVLNDNIIINAKDYTEAIKRRSDAIKEATIQDSRWVQRAVEAAINANGEFAKVAARMKNTEAKFKELISNPQKYSIEYKLPTVQAIVGKYDLASVNQAISEDKETFESDLQKQIKDISATIRMTWDKEIGDLNASEKDALAIGLKNMLEQADGTSEEVKAQWAKTLENAFDVDLGFKADAVSLIGEEFAENLGKTLGPDLADKVRRGLTLTPEEKQKVHKAIYDSYKSVFDRSDEDVRRALNEAMANWDKQQQTFGLVALKINKNSGASDWQQQILDALGTADLSEINIKISGQSDINSFIEEARKGYRAAQEAINELKPILIKAGVDFVSGEEIRAVPVSLKDNKLALQAIDDYNAKIRASKAIRETLKSQGIYLDVDPNKKSNNGSTSRSRSKKDALAEQLKQRFKDIKDAYAMFKEWAKLEGKEAAFKRVGESGLFATLAPDKLPQTVDEYLALIDNLEKELKAAGIKGKSQRESLANELIKERLGINKDTFKEQLQLALDKVSKEAERQLADWNLFDKIRKATGNEKLAMSIAFGMNADATKDYPTLVKKQFAKIAKEVKGIDLTFDNTTLEQAKNLGDEIAKSYQDTASKLEKYAREQKDAIADILNEYQSLQDKLTKIDADRDRKIKVIRQSDMSAPDKAKFIQRINVEADYQKFTQSNEYLQFFAGIYALTKQEATRIGDLIEQNLNRRLQAGTISAEDYYKEIGRIRQQLNKLRNVKSDAMTFLTGGVKGLAQKRQEANDAKRLETIQKIQALEEELAEAEANAGDFRDAQAQGRVLQAKLALANAKKELDIQDRIREKLMQNQKQWQSILDVANIASGIANGMSDAFNSIKDMADAFGADTESGVWGDIGAVLDTFSAVTGGIQKTIQSAMSGDVGGVIGGVVSTITTPFTIWSKLHDKKLQKLIDRSKEAAQIMQNQYDILEKRMANFLGNAAGMNTGVLGGAYGKQRQLMQNQMKELEKQRQAEIDKKKTDNSVVEDYNKQIEEMRISIHEFALEAAKELYGIDLNERAQQLGDALVDAFAKGEDAAAAFDKTVGDILRDITKKMISQDILAPMFADLRNFLFGENGMSGAFGSDFKLDASELAAMKNYLDKIKNEGIPAAEELFDAINKATGGMLDDTEKAKSGLSAGIQSVTEDTADLLASYVNAIRASVAMNEGRWERLLGESLPQISVIAQSQLDAQRQIAENTQRTAKATEAIVKSNDDISRLLTRVTQGGAKFYIH